MKVYLATDHAGFTLKEKVKKFLLEKGYAVEDFGANTFDPQDDYPDFISKVGKAVSQNPKERGIIFGGSGQGEAMLANKYKSVRANLFYTTKIPPKPADINGRVSSDPYEIVRLAREHNDANVLSIGARLLTDDEAIKAAQIFLETPFPCEERHVRRIEKVKKIEEECCK